MSQTFTALGQTWTSHTPGDPMPCDPTREVWVLFRDRPSNFSSKQWNWHDLNIDKPMEQIIGWRYADQPKTEPTELEKTMKPKPRPTPESDKAAREGAYFQHGDYAETCGKQLVHLKTARRLERERDEARDLLILCTNLKEVQSMTAELEQLQEENRLMRDAIKEAHVVLSQARRYIQAYDSPSSIAMDDKWAAQRNADLVIAKLQPFIKP